jgi:hypothetical protein
MDSPAGESCKECNVGVGCKIYDIAPEDCKKYKCFYNRIENLDIKFRPDKCGIIFERATDSIFHGIIDNDILMLNNVANEMIEAFVNKGFSVVLKTLNTEPCFIFNTKDRTANEVFKEIKEATW